MDPELDNFMMLILMMVFLLVIVMVILDHSEMDSDGLK